MSNKIITLADGTQVCSCHGLQRLIVNKHIYNTCVKQYGIDFVKAHFLLDKLVPNK